MRGRERDGRALYDCFPFFNELELLDLRLHLLDQVADRFVLVEATRTHQGERKPLYFHQNRDRFRRFLDRIIHVVVDDYPETSGSDPWTLENHQRRCIARALRDAHAEDVVVLSDVDEIPDPAKLRMWKSRRGVTIFDQRLHYYYLNYVLAGDPYDWIGARPVMVSVAEAPEDLQLLRDLSLTLFSGKARGLGSVYQRLRHWQLRKRYAVRVVEKGGWHFTYCGGIRAIQRKLEAFAHREYNTPEIKEAGQLRALIAEGKDIFRREPGPGGRELRFRRVDLDSELPRYVAENRERYRELILDRD